MNSLAFWLIIFFIAYVHFDVWRVLKKVQGMENTLKNLNSTEP